MPADRPIVGAARQPAFGDRPVMGARSGGMTAHIQGPHLIPNVGREAMLLAECVRRKPKAKPKPAPKPEPKQKLVSSKKKKKSRRSPSRSRSRPRDGSRNTHKQEEPSEESEDEEHYEPVWRAQDEEQDALSLAEQREREAKRLEEERRQLQELKQAQEKKKQQEANRRQKLSNVFALSSDDFDKEEQEQAKRVQAAQESLKKEEDARARAGLSLASRPTTLRPDPSPLLDEAAPGSGFEKCWKNWDFSRAEDPSEVARQFMRVSKAKRRGYAPPGGGRSRSPRR